MRRKSLLSWVFPILSLAIGACASIAVPPPAHAQPIPGAWNYSFDASGNAQATYPGNTKVLGSVTQQGALNQNGPILITPPSGSAINGSQAFVVNQTITGTQNGFNASQTLITDSSDEGPNFGVGYYIRDTFGGLTAKGGHSGVWADTMNNGATAATNTNRNYVGLTGQGWATASDGGTGLTIANAKGAFFGLSGTGVANSGATNLLNVTGAELNTSVQTGSSVAIKTILQLVGEGNDAVGGTLEDAMLDFWDQNGAGGHAVGIMIGNGGGSSQWPIKSTGALFQTGGSGSAALGIDLSNTTFSTASFKSNGFQVSGTGGVSAAQVTVSTVNPQLTLIDTGNANYQTLLQGTGSCTRIYDQTGGGQAINVCLAYTSVPKLQLTPTTVGALPTCNGTIEGRLAAVTDANSATFNAAAAGGGSNHVMAYCNGTGWTIH